MDKDRNIKRVKGFHEFTLVCNSSFMTLVGEKRNSDYKDYFHPMMKLLPEGSNDFRDVNCPRSTG